MKLSEKFVNSTLNTILGRKYPEVRFDFSYYQENLFGNDRNIFNVFMLAPGSYYEKYGDGMKHYNEIESEVKTILTMFGLTKNDRIYYHWLGDDYFD